MRFVGVVGLGETLGGTRFFGALVARCFVGWMLEPRIVRDVIRGRL